MTKSREKLTILLLQIREDEATMLEEFYEFVQFSGLHQSQIVKLNTYETKQFSPEIILGFDALFIGGSSDASVLKLDEFAFINDCKRLIRFCYNQSIPVFASCFGFQLAVQELGGEVQLDEKNSEMGMYQIALNQEAKNDPLLNDKPDYFWAVSGHKERAIRLPTICQNFASTPLCPYHLFKVKDKPFYGFQFHPEVDKKDFIARLTRYQARYLNKENQLQTIIDEAIHETTTSNQLLKDFIDRVVLPTSHCT